MTEYILVYVSRFTSVLLELLCVITLYSGLCLDIWSIFSVFVRDFITKLIPNSMRRHTKQNSNKCIWSFGLLWSVFENLKYSCIHHINNQSASQSVLGLQSLPSSVSQSSSLRRTQLTYELKPCNFFFYSTPLQLLEWPCCAVRGGLGTLVSFMLGLIPITAHSAGKNHHAVIIIWLELLWSIM